MKKISAIILISKFMMIIPQPAQAKHELPLSVAKQILVHIAGGHFNDTLPFTKNTDSLTKKENAGLANIDSTGKIKNAKMEPLAAAGLTLSIMGLPILLSGGIIGGAIFLVAGYICGFIAKNKIRKSKVKMKGKGMAEAATVISGIAIILSAILFLIYR